MNNLWYNNFFIFVVNYNIAVSLQVMFKIFKGLEKIEVGRLEARGGDFSTQINHNTSAVGKHGF